MKLKLYNYFYMTTSQIKFKAKHSQIFNLIFAYNLLRLLDDKIWR